MVLKKISKNCYKGKEITDPRDLHLLVMDKEAVYNRNMGIRPAAVIINMPFFVVMDLISSHQLFRVYKVE